LENTVQDAVIKSDVLTIFNMVKFSSYLGFGANY